MNNEMSLFSQDMIEHDGLWVAIFNFVWAAMQHDDYYWKEEIKQCRKVTGEIYRDVVV